MESSCFFEKGVAVQRKGVREQKDKAPRFYMGKECGWNEWEENMPEATWKEKKEKEDRAWHIGAEAK